MARTSVMPFLSAAMLVTAVALVLLPQRHNVQAATTTVAVGDNFFGSAGSHTTTIAAGDTVHWDRIGGAPHSVTADGCPADCPFNEPLKTSGSFDFTFNTPGTYGYYCTLHGSPGQAMAGTIVVQAVAATATATPVAGATNTPVRSATASATATAVPSPTQTPVPVATPTIVGTRTAPQTPTASVSGGAATPLALPSTGAAGVGADDRRRTAVSIVLAAAGLILACGAVLARRRPQE